MEILLTNDDGISAEGIIFLAEKAKAFGHVTVVAPSHQCSAMSHRITIGSPMCYRETDFPVEGVLAYSVDGTPADCVKVALEVILPFKPDLVISGMNNGYNVGYDIIYSGTIGAAMEGLMNGIPSIAVSRNNLGTLEVADLYFSEVFSEVLSRPISSREIWNINFPACPPEECKGILWDRTVGREEYYNDRLLPSTFNGEACAAYPDIDLMHPDYLRGSEDSDLYAVISRYISVGKVTCMVMM